MSFDIKFTRLGFKNSYQIAGQALRLNCSAGLAIQQSIFEALPGKLDIKRHSPCILNVQGIAHISVEIRLCKQHNIAKYCHKIVHLVII